MTCADGDHAGRRAAGRARSPRAGSARRRGGRRSRPRSPARSAIPALTPPSSSDWVIAAASWKSRKPLTSREARQVGRALQAADVDRQEQRREDDQRREELRPAQRVAQRPPRERDDATRSRGLTAPALGLGLGSRRPRGAGRSWRRRRRRASGCSSSRLGDREAGLVQRAHDRRDRPRRRRASADRQVAARRSPGGGRRSARRPRAARSRSRRRRASVMSRCGRPTSAFSAAGVPSATILPAAMIPTRSASWSASSRYCVVRKTVVPSSLQAADLVPQRHARRRVQAGGRLVEEQHLGLVDQRHREVQAPAHAARVGADAALGGLLRPDALDQLGRARRAPTRGAMPCSVACSSISSRPVISRSSAASCSATPMRRRTSPGWVATSKPATVALPAGGAQQRDEHAHRRRLARAVGPEEAVDLARRDLEVDAVDGLAARP